jgi:hypothetical protein
MQSNRLPFWRRDIDEQKKRTTKTKMRERPYGWWKVSQVSSREERFELISETKLNGHDETCAESYTKKGKTNRSQQY